MSATPRIAEETMMPPFAARFAQFARSVVALATMTVVVPLLLVAASEARFDGRSPLTDLRFPPTISKGSFDRLLRERLTDDVIGDLVVRAALIVCWAAVVLFATTVVLEVLHMRRHGGLNMPDFRGLGFAQRPARVVATGLLVLVPTFGIRSPASALDLPDGVVASVVAPRAAPSRPRAEVASAAPIRAAEYHVVRQGESVYAIAERRAGPSPESIERYADQLLDLNLGREVAPGQRFTNAAFVDVGWRLELPAAGGAAPIAGDAVHVVQAGESLWSIAEGDLGDGGRWPEIFEVNRDRTFHDGATLDDPRVIRPGWDLAMPHTPPVAPSEPADGAVVEIVEPVAEIAVVEAVVEPVDEAVVEAVVEPVAEPVVEQVVEDAVDPVVEPASPPGVTIVRDSVRRPVAPTPEHAWLAAHHTPRQPLRDTAPPDTSSPTAAGGPISSASDAPSTAAQSVAPDNLLTMRRAAMLSAGALVLLASRRRQRMRQAEPHARVLPPTATQQTTERVLRLADNGDRFAKVECAVRHAALDVAASGARVVALHCSPEGAIELTPSSTASLPPPWRLTPGSDGERRWTLPAETPIGELAAGARRAAAAPCPALVQLGVDRRGWDVYVDLESIGVLHVGGVGDSADAVVAAIAATLASSVLAEVAHLFSVAVATPILLGHRFHCSVADAEEAVAQANRSVGPARHPAGTTFERRARRTGGELWEPAVVLVSSQASAWRCPALARGVAVVTAAPVDEPTASLRPDGELWVLEPHGLQLQPIGLTPVEAGALAALVDVPPLVGARPIEGEDDTLCGVHEPAVATAVAERDGGWRLMVRLLGPVTVVDRSGREIAFERSKTRELVAWLATHRDRSTRANARTALWDHDVRDATFANVVSEARRALARCVSPPEGEEWVGRSLTESLPLHAQVVSDADELERALRTARRAETPSDAIAALADALHSIRGLPFEGTSYLWPDAEGLTSHLILLATTASAELASHHLAIGDVEGVFAATGRGLRVLPGHEELIGLRMRAHARSGDHAGVRQEWDSYERMIVADPWSDGEPSPKLLELRRRLLTASPA